MAMSDLRKGDWVQTGKYSKIYITVIDVSDVFFSLLILKITVALQLQQMVLLYTVK